MTYRQATLLLESLGTAQNRKVYARHGVGNEMYGVSFADLGRLHREIKKNHALAQELWRSGNHDARVLATMVADPHEASLQLLDEWRRDLDNYVITNAFSRFVAATRFAEKRMEQWTKSSREWTGRAGWLILARLATKDDAAEDEYFAAYIPIIEERIHKAKNRVRDAMNAALIAIGGRSAALEEKAVAAAVRIGKVEVDHGPTGCKTPDSVTYIRKTGARKRHRSVTC
ncbi:MAG: DNA alkylation repair protein [Acidobacteria bacterium]|nr:DNA alkylation repair protein [Acidobacteriota bacterium]